MAISPTGLGSLLFGASVPFAASSDGAEAVGFVDYFATRSYVNGLRSILDQGPAGPFQTERFARAQWLLLELREALGPIVDRILEEPVRDASLLPLWGLRPFSPWDGSLFEAAVSGFGPIVQIPSRFGLQLAAGDEDIPAQEASPKIQEEARSNPLLIAEQFQKAWDGDEEALKTLLDLGETMALGRLAVWALSSLCVEGAKFAWDLLRDLPRAKDEDEIEADEKMGRWRDFWRLLGKAPYGPEAVLAMPFLESDPLIRRAMKELDISGLLVNAPRHRDYMAAVITLAEKGHEKALAALPGLDLTAIARSGEFSKQDVFILRRLEKHNHPDAARILREKGELTRALIERGVNPSYCLEVAQRNPKIILYLYEYAREGEAESVQVLKIMAPVLRFARLALESLAAVGVEAAVKARREFAREPGKPIVVVDGKVQNPEDMTDHESHPYTAELAYFRTLFALTAAAVDDPAAVMALERMSFDLRVAAILKNLDVSRLLEKAKKDREAIWALIRLARVGNIEAGKALEALDASAYAAEMEVAPDAFFAVWNLRKFRNASAKSLIEGMNLLPLFQRAKSDPQAVYALYYAHQSGHDGAAQALRDLGRTAGKSSGVSYPLSRVLDWLHKEEEEDRRRLQEDIDDLKELARSNPEAAIVLVKRAKSGSPEALEAVKDLSIEGYAEKARDDLVYGWALLDLAEYRSDALEALAVAARGNAEVGFLLWGLADSGSEGAGQEVKLLLDRQDAKI